jgi:hypothetical protein
MERPRTPSINRRSRSRHRFRESAGGGPGPDFAAGLRASDPETDVVVVLDSDTIWAPGTLTELPRPLRSERRGCDAAPGRV